MSGGADVTESRRSKLRLVAPLLLLIASSAEAAPYEHDLQAWGLINVWARVDKLRFFGEVQPRVSLTGAKFDRLLLRPAIGWQLTPETSLWIGYGWTPTFGPFRDEHRPFQQLLVEHKFGVFSFVNRTRFEQRFIGGTNFPSFRLRHMVRGVLRFGPSSPWGLAAYEELFVNFNSVSSGPEGGFDQNRFFLGLNLKVDAMQFELGYMNNFVARPGLVVPDRVNHNLTFMFVYTVP
jgi:hypothetical protein